VLLFHRYLDATQPAVVGRLVSFCELVRAVAGDRRRGGGGPFPVPGGSGGGTAGGAGLSFWVLRVPGSRATVGGVGGAGWGGGVGGCWARGWGGGPGGGGARCG